MNSNEIEPARVQPLNRRAPVKGEQVVYWMQAAQRAEYNHALEYAVRQANFLRQKLLVYFGLTSAFPGANWRHYVFMLEGLGEVRETLKEKGIGLIIEWASPAEGLVNFARNASLVVCDRGYLKIQREWRREAAARLACPLIQVESEVVVPVAIASGKEEYTAATLRRKMAPLIGEFLVPLAEDTPKSDSSRPDAASLDIADIEKTLSGSGIDPGVAPLPGIHGGTAEARRRLSDFSENRLDSYAGSRNDPAADGTSNLSPFLHFGQISPLFVALTVSRRDSPGREAFIEELVVRRELGINFVNYNADYDAYAGLPAWSRRTLAEHKDDHREYNYSLPELEAAATHDPYWNAAQTEMVRSGKMHGYMRMYWGKKILEWVPDPEKAFAAALYLNNKYELDGRDPGGYAGVAWCFGKHDRPWGGRPVFGNIRYMNDRGLERKFDIARYVRRQAGL